MDGWAPEIRWPNKPTVWMVLKSLKNNGINYLHINWFSRRISEPSTVEGKCSLKTSEHFLRWRRFVFSCDTLMNQEPQAATCSFIIQTCCNLAGLSTIEGHILQTRLALLKSKEKRIRNATLGHRYIHRYDYNNTVWSSQTFLDGKWSCVRGCPWDASLKSTCFTLVPNQSESPEAKLRLSFPKTATC